MAGCNTAVSNIMMSMIVMLTLFWITSLFKYTPNAILASIIISAVLCLIDFDAVVLLWKIDKFDFLACMGAFFVVIFVSIEIGILIACSVRSRIQVNYMAGCNTTMSNIVMSMIVMLTPFVITLLFKYTSNAILTSIIISAVLGLIDFDTVVLHWKIYKFDFLACMRAFFGEVFVSAKIGLFITCSVRSRRQVNYMAGCNTTMLNIVMSMIVMLNPFVITLLFKYTSNDILASIIISVVLGLIDFDVMVLHWKIDKFDFLACIRAFFGVVFVSAEIGLVITYTSNAILASIIISAVLGLIDFDAVVLYWKINKFDFLACMQAFFGVIFVSVEIGLVITYTSNAILTSIIIYAVLGLIDFDAVVLHWKIDKFDFLACIQAFFDVVFCFGKDRPRHHGGNIFLAKFFYKSHGHVLQCSYTSNATLASIIIFTVLGLIDFDAVVLHWKIDKFDFQACMLVFSGVVFVSVEIGLFITVGISFCQNSSTSHTAMDYSARPLHHCGNIILPKFFYKYHGHGLQCSMDKPHRHVARPRNRVLGKNPKTSQLHGVLQFRDVEYCDVYDCDVDYFCDHFDDGHRLQCSVRFRRQVNYMAGCNIALSNIVMSMIVMLTRFVITLLFKYTSNAILTSIIIFAVLGLIDIDAVVLHWKIDKFDFLACMRAFFGMVFVSVEIGLVITEYLFAKILLQVTRPQNVVLGKIPKTSQLHGGLQYDDVEYYYVYDCDAIDKFDFLACMPAFFGLVFVSVEIGLVIAYTSNSILTSIIISAVLGLIDFDAVVLHWNIDKFDFQACIRAFFGVVEIGLVITVGISFCQNSSTSNTATDCSARPFVITLLFKYTSNAILAFIIIFMVLGVIDFDAVVLHWKIDKFYFQACMRVFFGVVFLCVEIGLFITYTSNAILASIIISVVLGLIDFDAVVLHWKIDKFDFLACMFAFFGVVFVSPEIDLVITCSVNPKDKSIISNAILASIIISVVLGLIEFDAVVLHWKIDKFDFLALRRPTTAVLGKIPKTSQLHGGLQYCNVEYCDVYDCDTDSFCDHFLFKYSSNAIQTSIIISAVLGLIDFYAVVLHWQIDKFDFLACIRVFFGVVFVSVEIVLVITVVISFCQNSSTSNTAMEYSARWEYLFAKILLQVTRPRNVVLDKIPKTSQLHGLLQYDDVEYCDVCLVITVGISFYQNSSTSNTTTDCSARLIDFDAVVLHWKIDKFDFQACIRAFFGVVFVSVEIGLVITYTLNSILASIIISAVLGLIDFDAVVLHWKIDKFDFIARMLAFFGVVFVLVEVGLVVMYTLNAILTTIIIFTVLGLIAIVAVVLHWKIDKFDFLACMRVFFGVVLVSVEIGLVITASSSRWEYLFAKILLQVTQPRTAVFDKISKTSQLHGGLQYRDVEYLTRPRTRVLSKIPKTSKLHGGLQYHDVEIVISMIVMLNPFLITSLFKNSSNAILASIIISAVLGLIDYGAVVVHWKIDKFEFLACMLAFFGVVFVSDEISLVVMYTSNAVLSSIIISAVLGLIDFHAVVLHWKIDKFDFLACMLALFDVVFVSDEIGLVIMYTAKAIIASIIISAVLGLIDFDAVVLHWKIDKFDFLAGMRVLFGVVFVSAKIGLVITYTSNAILASIIISAVLGLIDFDDVFLLWKIDKFDFLACMRAFFGVVFVSDEIGLVIMVSNNIVY
ncbi:hypothetical protein L1987_78139 [Smallanthus sonchifolius]|uniref:Uncharacterized protein n=1 Tax=Smallanthus sonchifolius TaxID=185202 RepID=A0ACB8ZBM3_9ASTR|nr:hypothetical protein L1987_78139 [Smallanthus sonchifolius]